jgi:uncharacterized protein YbcV (DUF1398 family)
MILYSVTVNIEPEIENDWLTWMKHNHIPKVMATGKFKDFKFLRLLQEVEGQGMTYNIQYYAETIGDVEAYLEHDAPILAEEHRIRYLNKHVAFRTLLEEVDISNG